MAIKIRCIYEVERHNSAIMSRNPLSPLLALLLAAMLTACATAENNYDPLEPINRITDAANDTIDRVTLKPVAQGYKAAVPTPMRHAVGNFFDNVTYLNTVLNAMLQGKFIQSTQDLIRFLINSTLGIGGLVDVATTMGLERHEEDFGQTLATWGVGQGAYVVYPLSGPNSLRNTPNYITSALTDPLFWTTATLAPYLTGPIAILKYVDKRAQLLDASNMRDELALDPYIFTREAWRQNREYKIHDGNPPAPQTEDESDGWEEEWEEDWGDSEGANENTLVEEAGPKGRIAMGGASGNASQHIVTDSKAIGSDITPTSEVLAGATDTQMFVINIASFISEVDAAAVQGELQRGGIACEVKRVTINGRSWYRIYSIEKVTKADASKKLEEMKKRSGFSSAWLEPVKP